MERIQATKILRMLLDENGLPHWKIRLTTDLTKSFLGMCDEKIQTIILNAHHVDSHPAEEVIDTIKHEIAHALVGCNHGHDEIWAKRARELGCTNTLACSHLTFDPRVIDAIHSGAEINVEFEEETHVIRRPKVTIARFQEKCPVCGKVAKEVSRVERGGHYIITLECFHILIKDSESKSKFEEVVFDGISGCKHVWEKTICKKCNAKKLYPYQIEGARFLEKQSGRAAIFDDPGLGKTIQALVYLKYNRASWPFLWVTKAALKFQHAEEIRRIVQDDDMLISMISSSKDQILKGFHCYIISYDLFRRLDLERLTKIGIKTIILDECQAIKNPDSSRTQAIRKVAREIPHIIPLSGTPWKNRGSEFFVVLNMLDPKLFWSYEHFVKTDCDVYYEGAKTKIGGIANPESFKKKIAHLAIRRERKEVLPELPPLTRTALYTELEGASKKLYNEELEKLLALVREGDIDGTEDSNELKQKIRGLIMVMRQIVGLAKVPTTCEFAKEFLENTDRKLIIFVHHIDVGKIIVESLGEWCKENNQPMPLAFTGGMKAEDVNDIQLKFNGPNYRLLVASTLAAGEGLNLQTCSDVIIHERQWNSANEEQAEGRILRIGQKADKLTATYVHAKDTVDVEFEEIVETKRRNFETGMNKDGYVHSWEEANVMDELIKRLRSKK